MRGIFFLILPFFAEIFSAYVGQTGSQFATRMKEHQFLLGVRTRISFGLHTASQPATRLIGPGPQWFEMAQEFIEVW